MQVQGSEQVKLSEEGGQSQKGRNAQGQETKQPQTRHTGKNTFQNKTGNDETLARQASYYAPLPKPKCTILESNRKHLLHVILRRFSYLLLAQCFGCLTHNFTVFHSHSFIFSSSRKLFFNTE